MLLRLSPIAAALLLPAATPAIAQQAALTDAISSGDAGVAIRYRFEHVDQDGFGEDANASTARLRLNYRTAGWRGWAAFGEFDHVFHVLLREFNSGAGTSPGRTQYPVVADPSGPDLNQLYVHYDGGAGWSARIGRQRLLLDNQRFVGNVGWRQNEQTYDAATFTTDLVQRTALSYSYLNTVRRIFGDDVDAGRADLDGHLLNASVTLTESWSLVPYLYHLDYNDAANAANSSTTMGVRVSGAFAAGDGTQALVAEVATQSDAGDNPLDYDADYFHIDAQWALPDGATFGAGVESLGGDPAAGGSFRTPLATLHRFQGWADQFLATPTGGIDDVYASLKIAAGGWELTGIFHDFSAASGGGDYGTEFDVSASRSFGKRYGLLIKAALFNADSPPFIDTTKFWVQWSASYP
ncbi:MAG: alginate export family protein [Woeseiaceae bacterium]|nr:alginate export family protein [Woeseiaceae bacterium]